MLDHPTWPNIFATISVINFPNFKLWPVILWRKNWTLLSSLFSSLLSSLLSYLVNFYLRPVEKKMKKKWTLFSFFSRLRVIYQRSRNNEPKRCKITKNVPLLFSVGGHFFYL